jgi:hypothetical protein
MTNYHCLVAGLPELRLDENKLSFSLKEFRDELKEVLSDNDFAYVKLFFKKFDNQNLLLYLENPETELDERGSLSSNDFSEILQMVKEEEAPSDERITEYFKEFILAYLSEKPIFQEMSWEDQITSQYNDYALKCKNDFISKWFEFDLNITNIFTAINCKNYEISLEGAIVGNNEIAQSIRSSNSKDFGISAEFPYLDEVLRIADESNLFEREKKVDLLKWRWIEENAFFKYFSIEKVFAYMLQLEIIERWSELSSEKGDKVFREFVAKMQGSFEFADEFTLS